MANEIEIRVVGTDATGGTITSVDQKVEKLAKTTSGAGQEMGQTRKRSQELTSSLLDMSKIAGGILLAEMFQRAAERAREFLRSSTEAASGLSESVNAVQKTFGDSSQTILDWSKNNAVSFGLSQRAFQEASTPLGAILKNQGLQLDQVSEHTLKLTQRAADMASVFNTSVPDALEALQAGLRGEQDPLERYGVSLSAAAVDAQALADTGKTSALALTAQEKALARLTIIYKQTADTAGDFQQTSNGMANSQRIATAEFENAKAKIGTAYMPVVAAAAKVAGNLATSLTALPQPALIVTAVLGGLGAAALIAAPRIQATKVALDEMLASSSRAQVGLARTAIAVGKVGLAMGALQVATSLVNGIVGKELNPNIEAFGVGLEDWSKKGKLAGESARLLGKDGEKLNLALRNAADSGAGFAQWMESWIPGASRADKSWTKNVERVKALDDALAAMVREDKASVAADIFQSIADRGVLSIDKLKSVLPEYQAAMEVAAHNTGKLGDAATQAASSIKDLTDSVHAALSEVFGLESAEDKVADAVQRLRDQVKRQKEDHEKGAASFDRNTQAGRDNAAMVRDLISDYEDQIVEYRKVGKNTDDLATQLEDQLVQMGFSREGARRYTSQLALMNEQLAAIPSSVPVTVTVNVEGDAQRELNRLRIGASSLANFIGPIAPPHPPSGYTGHAAGGPIGAEAGGWTRINEQGQEIAKLPTGTMVIPHGDSQALLSGPQQIELVVSVDLSGDDVVDAITRRMRFKVRTLAGGSAQTYFS